MFARCACLIELSQVMRHTVPHCSTRAGLGGPRTKLGAKQATSGLTCDGRTASINAQRCTTQRELGGALKGNSYDSLIDEMRLLSYEKRSREHLLQFFSHHDHWRNYTVKRGTVF